MKAQLLRFILSAIIIYLAYDALNPVIDASQPLWGNETHYHGVTGDHLSKQHSDQFPNRRYARTAAANLNVGEPRTVRMIYFTPNDRAYNAEVVQKMKDTIRTVQTFYAEQMEAHGYGKATFRFETDHQGEPMVRRMDGGHPDSHYLDNTVDTVLHEVKEAFNLNANIYLIVIDNSTGLIGLGDGRNAGGVGARDGKNGGFALVFSRVDFQVIAHEIGHAFGLNHDFHDNAYIMSYGLERNRLSACHAEYLSVHPYFNLNTSVEEGEQSTIELTSPRLYPAGAQSVPIRLKVNDSDGLHQLILFVTTREPHFAAGFYEVKACRELGGDRDTVVRFDYDGVLPSDGLTSLADPVVHPIYIKAVDMNGNLSQTDLVLFSETLQPLSKISGDNQRGLPNTSLPLPLIVELRDLNDGTARGGVPVKFTITAGDGKLGVEHIKTSKNGRAQSTLILGRNPGTNTVEVSAAEFTVTFSAIAEAAAHIPDAALRTAFETVLKVAPGNPIAPAKIETLTVLNASEAKIRDLTGLEMATSLIWLDVSDNDISDISPLVGLTNLRTLFLDDNSISDISPVAGLTNLRKLWLEGNAISDITALVGLTNLETLFLGDNSISDISPVAGLTNLTWLNLKDNNISDISPVAELANLSALFLGDNSISDISALVGLTKLWRLGLEDNMIGHYSVGGIDQTEPSMASK